MNYDFIEQSDLSLRILKSMMGLLDQMDTQIDFLKKMDKYNIILTIKNILQGDNENKKYFLDNGGTMKFVDIILTSNDIQLIEMCIYGIAEQASYKNFMIDLLVIEKRADEENGEGSGPLKKIIKQCLNLTDNWHSEVNLQDYETQKKQAMTGELELNLQNNPMFQQSQMSESIDSISDSQFSYSINESV